MFLDSIDDPRYKFLTSLGRRLVRDADKREHFLVGKACWCVKIGIRKMTNVRGPGLDHRDAFHAESNVEHGIGNPIFSTTHGTVKTTITDFQPITIILVLDENLEFSTGGIILARSFLDLELRVKKADVRADGLGDVHAVFQGDLVDAYHEGHGV